MASNANQYNVKTKYNQHSISKSHPKRANTSPTQKDETNKKRLVWQKNQPT